VPKETFTQPDALSSLPGASSDYRIAPLDKLSVSVFQVPDLTRETEVDLGGNITVPLIGSVRAVGLSTVELQDTIEQRLNERYLRNADVTVLVREASGRFVTIDGAVVSPGQHELARPTTLLRAIALARGTTDTSNPRRTIVFRQVQGQRMGAAFDLTAIRRGAAEDPTIYSGDVIVVDGSRIKEYQRELFSAMPVLGLLGYFTRF
jgi:polysaccharide export outer membrane protein